MTADLKPTSRTSPITVYTHNISMCHQICHVAMLPGCRGEMLFIEVTHGAHYVGLLHLMVRFHTEANAFLILPVR